MVDVQRVMDEIAGRIEDGDWQRAVFAQPVQLGERIVVPVAKVRWAGGGGGGGSPEAKGEGGGAGVAAAAAPVGFIEITPHGAVFNPINDPGLVPRYLFAGAVAAYLLLRGIRKLVR